MPLTKETDFRQFRFVLQFYLSFSKLEIAPQNGYLHMCLSTGSNFYSLEDWPDSAKNDNMLSTNKDNQVHI